MRKSTRKAVVGAVGALAALALVAADAGAQQGTRRPARRQQPIEIRGQVPTPQVVTVRPREVPQYNRRILVPNFYDHDFWPAILPGYQLVRRQLITGNVRLDSLARTDSVRLADSGRTATFGRAAIGVGLHPRRLVGTDSAARRMNMPGTPGDTTRRATPTTPGTTPPGGAPPTTTPPGSTTPGAATTGTPPASRPR